MTKKLLWIILALNSFSANPFLKAAHPPEEKEKIYIFHIPSSQNQLFFSLLYSQPVLWWSEATTLEVPSLEPSDSNRHYDFIEVILNKDIDQRQAQNLASLFDNFLARHPAIVGAKQQIDACCEVLLKE